MSRPIRSEAELSRILARPGYRVAEQFGGEVVTFDSPAAALTLSEARDPPNWDGTLTPELARQYREEPAADPRVASQLTLLELRELKFRLPQPVSVNELYGVNLRTGQKFLLPAQKQFRSQVISIVHKAMREAEQRDQPLLGKVEARVLISDRLDIDNGLKSLFDGLQHAKAMANDRQIVRLVVDRIPMPHDREWCDVHLKEIAA